MKTSIAGMCVCVCVAMEILGFHGTATVEALQNGAEGLESSKVAVNWSGCYLAGHPMFLHGVTCNNAQHRANIIT